MAAFVSFFTSSVRSALASTQVAAKVAHPYTMRATKLSLQGFQIAGKGAVIVGRVGYATFKYLQLYNLSNAAAGNLLALQSLRHGTDWHSFYRIQLEGARPDKGGTGGESKFCTAIGDEDAAAVTTNSRNVVCIFADTYLPEGARYVGEDKWRDGNFWSERFDTVKYTCMAGSSKLLQQVEDEPLPNTATAAPNAEEFSSPEPPSDQIEAEATEPPRRGETDRVAGATVLEKEGSLTGKTCGALKKSCHTARELGPLKSMVVVFGAVINLITPTLKFRFTPQEMEDHRDDMGRPAIIRDEDPRRKVDNQLQSTIRLDPDRLGISGAMYHGCNADWFNRAADEPGKVALGMLQLGWTALVILHSFKALPLHRLPLHNVSHSRALFWICTQAVLITAR